MPSTTTAPPRRLGELGGRPAPQLFERASALTLFTGDPEPEPSGGHGDGNGVGGGTSGIGGEWGTMGAPAPVVAPSAAADATAGGTGGRRVDRRAPSSDWPALRRCLTVAGAVALSLLSGVGLSAFLLSGGDGPSGAAAPAATTPQAASSSGAPGPAGTGLPGVAPVAWSSVGLSMGDGLTARAYFGQLDQVIGELRGTATFLVDPDYRASHPQRCALTVVVTGVKGRQSVAYATDLEGDWTAPESVPSRAVSTDRGVVHHQLVAPPTAAAPGATWTSGVILDTDGKRTTSGAYALTLVDRDTSDQTWSFGGRIIRCSIG